MTHVEMWLNLAVFDSKDPTFLVVIVCLLKSVIPQFPAPEFEN